MSNYNFAWNSVNCLVTGGAGFIGSNLSQKLVQNGANVTILDDFSTGRMENLRILIPIQ